MNELDLSRHSLGIDPHLQVWGWEVAAYLFLGGMAAGVMILSSVLALRGEERSRTARLLAFAPAVLVSLGMGALFLDLEHKTHVLRFYAAFRWTSPMSWGAWILLAVYPASLLFALSGIAPERFARPRQLAWANLAAGTGLGIYTGVLLGTLGARALWSSALLGPLFLASGVSTGAAFLLLFRLTDEERHAATRWDLIAIGVEVALLLLYLIGLRTGSAASRAAVAQLLGGPYTAVFWTAVAIAGLAIPAALEVLELRRFVRPALVAPALVLLGGLSLRLILVAAGQA